MISNKFFLKCIGSNYEKCTYNLGIHRADHNISKNGLYISNIIHFYKWINKYGNFVAYTKALGEIENISAHSEYVTEQILITKIMTVYEFLNNLNKKIILFYIINDPTFIKQLENLNLKILNVEMYIEITICNIECLLLMPDDIITN